MMTLPTIPKITNAHMERRQIDCILCRKTCLSSTPKIALIRFPPFSFLRLCSSVLLLSSLGLTSARSNLCFPHYHLSVYGPKRSHHDYKGFLRAVLTWPYVAALYARDIPFFLLPYVLRFYLPPWLPSYPANSLITVISVCYTR